MRHMKNVELVRKNPGTDPSPVNGEELLPCQYLSNTIATTKSPPTPVDCWGSSIKIRASRVLSMRMWRAENNGPSSCPRRFQMVFSSEVVYACDSFLFSGPFMSSLLTKSWFFLFNLCPLPLTIYRKFCSICCSPFSLSFVFSPYHCLLLYLSTPFS